MRGLELFLITSMALGITFFHCWNMAILEVEITESGIIISVFILRYLVLFCDSLLWITWSTSPNLVHMNHKNKFSNLRIKPRFQRFQNHVDQNSELQTPRLRVTNQSNWICTGMDMKWCQRQNCFISMYA